MMESTTLYEVWWREGVHGEQCMEDSHQAFWHKVIEMIVETDLRTATILDFGCNQGGFLRLLYTHRLFREYREAPYDPARQNSMRNAPSVVLIFSIINDAEQPGHARHGGISARNGKVPERPTYQPPGGARAL
jgi:hypothetical protein